MIYFIKHTDYVKIGYTNVIHKRLSSLQVSCPIKLKLLGLIEGQLKDEELLHKKFKHLSSSGEWFNYNEELQDFVDGLDKWLMWEMGFEDHESSPMSLIKQCRLSKNMSMEELGELLGITKQGVMDMEKRDVQGNITVETITKALSVIGYKYGRRAKNV